MYKERVLLRGDHAKDDTGFKAVFTEQGASASHMTAVEVLGTISRLTRKAREANDAISAYAHVKMKDAPRQLKLRATECATKWLQESWERVES